MVHNRENPLQVKPRFLLLGFCFLAVSVLSLHSCFKDDYFNYDGKDFEANWNPDWALPLVNTTINVGDVLDRFDDDDLIVINPLDGQLALVYHSTVFSLRADEFLVLPDQTAGGPYNLTPVDIAAVGSGNHVVALPPGPVTLTMPNGASLNQIDFSGGDLVINMGNTSPYSGSLTVSIPSLTQGGNPFSQTVPWSGPNSSTTFNLAGWSLAMTANTFNVSATININGPTAGGAVGQQLVPSMAMQGITFSRILGDLGQQPIATGLDSVRLRIFDQAYNGVIFYDDPTLTATFINGVGAPVQITVHTFETHSDFNPPVTVTGFGPVEQITGAPSQNQTATTSFELNTGNSNIATVVQSSPDAIIYDVDGLTNPGGGASSNFVLDSSRVQLDVDVELPLIGRAVDFAKIDTVDFIIQDPVDSNGTISLGGATVQVDEIEFVELRLLVDNGFPAEAIVQAYFVDSSYNVIDSLFHGPQDYLFEAAPIDGNGVVTGRTEKKTDIRLTQSQLDNLIAQGSSFVILNGKLAETNNQGATTVRILESYSSQIFLGVRIKVKTTLEF